MPRFRGESAGLERLKIPSMRIWLITSVLLADDGQTLLAATVGEVDEKTHRVLSPIRLKQTPEIVAMIKSGKKVQAIWPAEEGDLMWDVQIVPAPGGGETIETITEGYEDDRTMAQLWTVDDLAAAATAKSKAGRH